MWSATTTATRCKPSTQEGSTTHCHLESQSQQSSKLTPTLCRTFGTSPPFASSSKKSYTHHSTVILYYMDKSAEVNRHDATTVSPLADSSECHDFKQRVTSWERERGRGGREGERERARESERERERKRERERERGRELNQQKNPGLLFVGEWAAIIRNPGHIRVIQFLSHNVSRDMQIEDTEIFQFSCIAQSIKQNRE